MDVRIELSAADAERLGCPPVVEVDPEKLTGRELIVMKKLTGWSLERLQRAMGGEPVAGGDGKPMYELGDDGEVLMRGGKPVLMLGFDPELLLLLAWLAVRRAKGEDVSWQEFDLQLLATGFSSAEGDVDDGSGKAPTPKARTTSRRSTAGTRRR